MDVREQAVDDGGAGSEEAGFFGGGLGFAEAILFQEKAAEFVMTQPERGILFHASANGLISFGNFSGVQENGAETDLRFGIFVVAEIDGFAEERFGVRAIAESELGHGELIGGFVIFGSGGDGLLEIGERGLRVFIFIKFLFAGFHEIAGLGRHGEFVDGNGLRVQGFVGCGNGFQIDRDVLVGGHGDVDIGGEMLAAGGVNDDEILGAAECAETELAGVGGGLGFYELVLAVVEGDGDVFGHAVLVAVVDVAGDGGGLLGEDREREKKKEDCSEEPGHCWASCRLGEEEYSIGDEGEGGIGGGASLGSKGVEVLGFLLELGRGDRRGSLSANGSGKGGGPHFADSE